MFMPNLIHYLETGSVELPDLDGKLTKFTLKELGIRYPIMLNGNFDKDFKIPNPIYEKEAGGSGPGGGREGPNNKFSGLGGPSWAVEIRCLVVTGHRVVGKTVAMTRISRKTKGKRYPKTV